MTEEKTYYIPVTINEDCISVAKFQRDKAPCTPAFNTFKEAMQWLKDNGHGDKKFL